MAIPFDHSKSLKPDGAAKGAIPIGSLMTAAAGKTLQRGGAALTALLSNWPAIAGPSLAAYTVPARLTKGAFDPAFSNTYPPSVLHLKVDPVKSLDVQYAVPQLIERINQTLGYKAVAQLRLVQSPLAPKTKMSRVSPAPASTNLESSPASRLSSALARVAAGVRSRQA